MQIKEKVMHDPALRLQDFQVFGEFGDINPSITDAATFTFLSAEKMEELFDHEVEGCFLYTRHLNPINHFLAQALAAMENTEYAQVTGSGMGAISCAILQICSQGDEIISSRTIYGGSYAIMKNFFPRFGINTHFVNITNLEQVKSKINKNTKVIYCETISNPLLEVADLRELRKLADQHGIKLIVDNTFSPMIVTPTNHGAHITVHSLTKFVNGMNDCVAGAICADHDYVMSLKSVNDGAAMLLGPVLDSFRASMILKNMRTLHVRMKQHSANAIYLAENISKLGVKVHYPGLKEHPQHALLDSMINPGFGYGGMLTIDAKDKATADALMIKMQELQVGYFAVSLGYFKTLFSEPGSSTSSEIPLDEQIEMGMSPGLIRFSVGLDNNIEESFNRIKQAMTEVGLI